MFVPSTEHRAQSTEHRMEHRVLCRDAYDIMLRTKQSLIPTFRTPANVGLTDWFRSQGNPGTDETHHNTHTPPSPLTGYCVPRFGRCVHGW